MNPVPLVSIICPTYNHSKYITACVESVRNQTFQDWEMIIINDGSTDNTKDIVEEIAVSDSRIVPLNQKNIGIFRLSETYNKALHLARGKYVAILEGDDLWQPDKLEKQIAPLESGGDIVLGWGLARILNEASGEIDSVVPVSVNPDLGNNDPPGKILKILFFQNPIPAATLIFRKDVLIESGGFQQGFNLPLVDIPTIFNLVLKGRFSFINEVLATWRVSYNQVTKTYPVEILKGRWQLSKYYFEKMNPHVKQSITVSLDEINHCFSDQLLITLARSGRYKLIRKDFKGARSDYRKAIFYPGISKPLWRLRSIVGFVFSIFGLDVEGISGTLGRVSYKNSKS